MDKFVKELDFNSDTFANVKRDMNFVLQRLIGNMLEKGSTNGSFTLKIDVSFTQEYIPNYDPKVEGESRKINKPSFKHKVTSTVQIADKKDGNMDTEEEPKGIPQLPGPTEAEDEDVIDAEYTELETAQKPDENSEEDVTDEILEDAEEIEHDYDYENPEEFLNE